MAPLKIAIIIEHFDATRGGAERLAGWLAREMAQRGHDVHVICHDVAARVNRYRQATQRASFDAHRSRHSHGFHEEHEAGAKGTKGAVHLHRLKGMRLNTALGFRLFGRRARALCLRARLLGKRFDVVHSFTVACPADIYHAQTGIFAAMQAQAAAIQDGATSAWKRLFRRLPGKQRTLLALEKRAVGRAGKIISSCEMMTRELAEHYGLDARQVVTLPTPRLEDPPRIAGAGGASPAEHAAADRAWFRAHYHLKESDRVALFVGHDFRRKGLKYAIQAISHTSQWKLVVVGLGKVREYVELAQELGLVAGPDGEFVPRMSSVAEGGRARPEARVLFVGPTRELAAVYAAADALLLPAFYEPSGVVALEALGHGLPVVSSAYVSVSDLVAGYRAGTVVADPRDTEALAGALENLPRVGSAEALALSARARAAAGSLSAGGYADQMEGLYRELARGR